MFFFFCKVYYLVVMSCRKQAIRTNTERQSCVHLLEVRFSCVLGLMSLDEVVLSCVLGLMSLDQVANIFKQYRSR